MKKLKTHDKYEDDWLTKKEAPYYYKECIWVFRFIGIFSLLNAVLLAVYWRTRNAWELLLLGIITVGWTGYAAYKSEYYRLLLLLAVETGICIWIYARGVWKKKNPPPIKGK